MIGASLSSSFAVITCIDVCYIVSHRSETPLTEVMHTASHQQGLAPQIGSTANTIRSKTALANLLKNHMPDSSLSWTTMPHERAKSLQGELL